MRKTLRRHAARLQQCRVYGKVMLGRIVGLFLAAHHGGKLAQIANLQYRGRNVVPLPSFGRDVQHVDWLHGIVRQVAAAEMRDDDRSFGTVDFDPPLVGRYFERGNFDDSDGPFEAEDRHAVVDEIAGAGRMVVPKQALDQLS